MALRLAGAGAQVGMSEADIMGLSTALSSVGIQAEMGGSAISKALVNMQVATSTGFGKFNEISSKTGLSLRDLQLSASNTPKHFTKVAESLGMTKSELTGVMKSASNLENFAKIAGMTGEEFKKSFETDAVGALGAFINGLGNAESAGTSAIEMLDEMGISEVRLRDSLLRAGNASELFAGAIETANGAWNENVALTNEAEERYKTFESKLAIFKNTIRDVGITVGETLLPALSTILDKLSELITWFGNLDPAIISTVTVITALVGALSLIAGPLLLLIGFLPTLISGFTAVGTVIGALTTFLAPAAAAAATAAGATSGLSVAMAVLSGPIGIAIAAITGITAALILAYNKVDWFRDEVDKAWSKIKELTSKAFTAIKETITVILKDVVKFGSDILNKFKDFWDENGAAIMAIVKLYFNNIKEQIKMVMGIIRGIFEAIWPIISSVVKIAWGVIKTVVSTSLDLVLGIIQSVMKLIQGDWKGAWETIKETAQRIMDNIVNFFKEIDLVQVGKDIINGLIKGIGSMVSAVGTAVKNIGSAIKDTFTNFFDIHSPSRVMAELGKYLVEGINVGISDSKNAVIGTMSGLLDVLKSTTSANADAIVAITKKAEKDRTDVQAEYAKKRAELARKTEQSAQSALKTSKNKKGEIVTTGTKRVHTIHANAAASLAKLNEDEAKKLAKIDEKAAAEKVKRGNQVSKEMLESVKTFVADKKSLEQLTLVAESEVWRRSVDLFKVGTKERVEAQKAYQASLKTINDEITKTNEEFGGKMAAISAKLRDDEQKLTDEYAKSVDDRAKSLANFASVFDEFEFKMEKSGEELLWNLKSQLFGFKAWQEEIDKLSAKAIDDGLLAELRAMGPKALPQLIALNSLTERQMTEYSALYKEKSSLARQQAEKELIGMKADTEKRIRDLRAVANTELESLRNDWTAKVSGITKASNDELMSLKKIGRQAAEGLKVGLESMEPALVRTATSIANAVKSAMAGAFDIHSPSRWMRDMIGVNMMRGWIDGMSTMRNSVLAVSADASGWMTPAVPQIAGYQTPKSGAGVGRSVASGSNVGTNAASGGIVQHIAVHSPTPLSPSEVARKTKQATQQLAMEWR